MNLLQVTLITSMQVLASIRWVDEADDSGPIDMDIFFDRAVIIAIKKGPTNSEFDLPNLRANGHLGSETIAPGVFISSRQILTSYNPFVKLIPDFMKDLFVVVLVKRRIVEKKLHVYDVVNVSISCAEQIAVTNNLTEEQLHGVNQTRSPVHDLMILSIEKEFEFLDSNDRYSFDDYSVGGDFKVAGPIKTRFAKKGDYIGREVKFASLGFRNKRHVKKSARLSSRTYEEDENVVEDCEEWIPRYWGYFICIKNVDNYKGVGSGALLVFNDTLYGVGSFALWKGNESLLVFTDVRPYAHLFMRVCIDLSVNTTEATDDDDDVTFLRDFL